MKTISTKRSLKVKTMCDTNIKQPAHYAGDGKITAKDAVKSMMHGINMPAYIAAWWFNAFKYLWRWPFKGGLDDLRKARECINNLIAEIEEKLNDDALL